VKLTPAGNVLKIIIREIDVDLPRPTLELQEEMTKFCGITNPAHVAILHWILGENDIQEIEKVLQRRGISNDVPDFDKLSQDGTGGERLSFSGLHAEPLHTEPGKVNGRRYRGRKTNNRVLPPDEWQSVDAVQSFVNRFDLASSFGKKIAQPWQDAEAKNMLSHICRLENIDPYLLLPQRDQPWTRQVMKAGGYPDDYVGMIFDGKPTTRSIRHTKGSQTFPAIVHVASEGRIHVGVSATANDLADEEILFAGELYVGVHIIDMTPALTLNTNRSLKYWRRTWGRRTRQIFTGQAACEAKLDSAHGRVRARASHRLQLRTKRAHLQKCSLKTDTRLREDGAAALCTTSKSTHRRLDCCQSFT
jgi:hypothetical protein